MPRTRGNMHHKHMMHVARLHERRGGMLGIALNAGLPPPPAIPVFIPGPPIVHNPNPPLHAHVAHHHGIHGLSTSSHGRYHERRGGESTLFQKFIHKIVHLLHEPRDAQYINEVFNIFQGGPLLYKHTVDVKIGSDMGTTMINTLQTLLTLHGMEENQLVDRLKYTLLKFIPSTTIRPKEGGGGHASVFALTCIDPRFGDDVVNFLENSGLHENYDIFTLAGASLGAEQKGWQKTFFDTLDLGIKLHGIHEVWCFDHMDCGMYQAIYGSDTHAEHISCLNRFKQIIKKKYPKLGIREFIIGTNDTIEEIKGGGKHYPTIQQKSNGMYEVEYKGSILASATNRTEILRKLNSILLQLKFPHHKEDEGEYDFESEVPEFKPRFKLDLLDKR